MYIYLFWVPELGRLYQYSSMKITNFAESYKAPPGKTVPPREPIPPE